LEQTSRITDEQEPVTPHIDNESLTDEDPKTNELSSEFIGRWSSLISTTNWEKGKIIVQWREALMGSEASASTFSDEAWSRRVGGVTAQHVGRLRRVHERFGATFSTYAGLYWSHFLAALDWDDAELWLEGAAQSGWSVSEMRRTRWESHGADAALEPRDTQIVSVENDEDYTPLAEVDDETNARDGSRGVAEGPRPEDPDFGDEGDPAGPTSWDKNGSEGDNASDEVPWDEPSDAGPSPFAQLPSLPVDFAEAVEQFKLAIIRHRTENWTEVAQADVVKALEALKLFVNQ
jgi:hypothetical protein